MSFSRSGSSSTRRMSPVFIGWIPSSLMRPPASSPGAAAPAAAATSAAADPVAQQAALHVAQRLELLDRLVGFLLLVAHGLLALGDLCAKHGRELLDRGRARVAAGHVVEELHRLLIILRRAAQQRIENAQTHAVGVVALPCERRG